MNVQESYLNILSSQTDHCARVIAENSLFTERSVLNWYLNILSQQKMIVHNFHFRSHLSVTYKLFRDVQTPLFGEQYSFPHIHSYRNFSVPLSPFDILVQLPPRGV